MNLIIETSILSIGMLIVCCIPLFFIRARSQAGLVFIFGTGAMLGIYVFDLVPDLVEMGGQKSLIVALGVGIIYSVIHLLHMFYHQTTDQRMSKEHKDREGHDVGYSYSHSHGYSFPLFFASIFSHCLSSGMLLSISQNYSQKIEYSVFFALLAHKGYESLTFTSIVLNQKRGQLWNFSAVIFYCTSLPIGVLIANLCRESIGQNLALYISSIAVGSLFGCLVFDFVIPSYHQVRRHRMQFAWLILGFILTRVFMGWL